MVWCDDDIDPRITEIKTLRAEHGDRLLTIRPRRTYGLADTDMDRIETFVGAAGLCGSLPSGPSPDDRAVSLFE